MLKQSHTTRSVASSKRSNLYDKVRQDLFEDSAHRYKRETVKTPSITTICLLQIQAYIIQILTNLPTFTIKKSANQSLSIYYLIQQKKLHAISSLKSVLIQCVRWFLLIVLLLLDNMARILNVEAEMTDITAQKEHPLIPQEQDVEEDYDDDIYSTETYHHDPCANTKPINGGISEPSSPTKRTLVSPSSPINSPTPNFVVRKTRNSFTNAPTPTAVSTSVATTAASVTEESPVFGPARTRVGHIRSLSNNMVDQKKPMSPQKLRRITAQREITLQNGILPIVPKKSNHAHHHHHHHTSKKPPVSSSVASRSSSESSTTKETHDRPRMQKTMSLSTAQQYQNELNSVAGVKNPLLKRQDPLNGVVQRVPHQH
ncbi:hypothetical protein MAM1_0132d06165 [Mucor ambiguus]|uniref:Uncharacterized protein n=1 Tax=Mucor ambiguus TaxID=91626 RepID=A0A0C9MTE3_9FUNG|nr:hypothetical protein MAM1_0132d06165 [Mucor ambiguus]